MAAEPTTNKQVPTSRPIVTTYLSSEFYKAVFQWLAEKDDRSMAWLAARWIESEIDEAISDGRVPSEVVDKLKQEVGND